MGPSSSSTDAARSSRSPGAPLMSKVNGAARRTMVAAGMKAGDELSFGFLKAGARVYIAVSGGIDVPVVLGSRSTYASAGSADLSGRPLQAGDVVPVGNGAAPRVGTIRWRSSRKNSARCIEKEVAVRVMPGLYDHRLTAEERETLRRRRVDPHARGGPHRPSLFRAGRRGMGGRAALRRRDRTRRTSSTPATPWVRSRSPAARSPSCCTGTAFRRRLRHGGHCDQRRHGSAGPQRTGNQDPFPPSGHGRGTGSQGAAAVPDAASLSRATGTDKIRRAGCSQFADCSPAGTMDPPRSVRRCEIHRRGILT